MNETTNSRFLAECAMTSPYFNDAMIDFPPFDADPAPALRTLDDLDAYARSLDDTDDRPLRDRLIDALDTDIRDLAHNSNYDAFLADDCIRELADDDFADIDAILTDPDTDFYDILADMLIARASNI